MPAELKSNAVADRAPAWRTMPVLSKVGTVIVWAVFALYVVLLLKLLIFSRPPGSEHSLNLVPFATISHYLFSDSAATQRFAVGNVLGNVVAFIPLGAALPLIRRRVGIWANLLIVACASIAVELVQGLFGLGASDIDDVILNALGGLVGILFFTLLRAIFPTWSRLVLVMAVLALVALPILAYLLLAIRLRM